MTTNRMFLGLLLLLSVLLTCIPIASTVSVYSATSVQSEKKCVTVYMIDAVFIVWNNLSEPLIFVPPQNLSFGTIEQKSWILLYSGVNITKYRDLRYNLTPGEKHYAYAVYKTVVCWQSFDPIISKILMNPKAYKEAEVPKELIEKYVKKPYPLVEKIVKKDFENWLKSKGYRVEDLSRAGLAIYAARFIYGGGPLEPGYIVYSASALPRPLDKVIKERVGDCDDMARVLVNLLWCYKIPAVIVYGDVIDPRFGSMVMQIENLTYTIIDKGPHAFVLVYAPPFGWISVDFLASSYLTFPFVIYNISTEAVVTEKDVKEIKKSLGQIKGLVVEATVWPKEVEKLISVVGEKRALQAYAELLVLNYIDRLGFEIPKARKLGLKTATMVQTLIKVFTSTTTKTVVEEVTKTVTKANTKTVVSRVTQIKTVEKPITYTKTITKTTTTTSTLTKVSTTTVRKTETLTIPFTRTIERTVIYTTTVAVVPTTMLTMVSILVVVIIGMVVVLSKKR